MTDQPVTSSSPRPLRERSARWLMWVWVGLVAVLAIIAVVWLHRLSHNHSALLDELFPMRSMQLPFHVAVVFAGITAIAYSLPGVARPGARGFALILVWSVLIVLSHELSHGGFQHLRDTLAELKDSIGWPGVLVLFVVYALLLAIPFVPGWEVGFIMMIAFDLTGVIGAYLATIAGLSLSFWCGRTLPDSARTRFMQAVGLDIVLSQRLAERYNAASWTGRHRHLGMALLLNLPGNSAFGGGGGIAFLAGLSRLYSWRGFLGSVALGVAPVPLAAMLGLIHVEFLLENHGILLDLLDKLTAMLGSFRSVR